MRRTIVCSSLLALAALLVVPGLALADGGVTFDDIALGGAHGLDYSRVGSDRLDTYNDDFSDGFIDVVEEYVPAPFKPFGAPGVAVLDFDGDGDLDIFVTNGPGAANSLFSSQLEETGQLNFVDVAAAAGVEMTDADAQGVCFGDIDNDGDSDLYVLAFNGLNHLFENLGNGTFSDITAFAGVDGGLHTSTSCSMGDLNNDGLLDIAVANAFDFTMMFPYTVDPYMFNEANQLFMNTGGNVFADVSAGSAITMIPGLPVPDAVLPNHTVAVVDYDADGDQDVLFPEDGRVVLGSPEAGFPRLYANDGTGDLTDVTVASNLNVNGGWHGNSWGDLNCDGTLDLFASNFGDYIFFPGQIPPGFFSSKWFLQSANGTFSDPGPGALVTVPTGWGNAMIDYDNDGDLDVVVYGGQDNNLFIDESNPGIVLQNQGCSATFTWDQSVIADPLKHVKRNVEGLATGDLDGNGFVDVVSVAGFDLPDDAPLAPMFSNPLGSVFDPTALGIYSTVPTMDPNVFQVTWNDPDQGSLAVEMNSGNGNGWVQVKTLGTVGILPNGGVNRDGIGALVSFHPAPGAPGTRVTQPVMGGSSFASQNSLGLTFGLGDGRRGMLEVLWPGGVRNRLYGVRSGDRVTLPEIPCSYDDNWANAGQYVQCVLTALDGLEDASLVSNKERNQLFVSALQAYFSAQGLPF